MTRVSRRLFSTWFAAALVAAMLLSAAGCGYRFRAGGKPVGLEVKSLAIPLITSTSSRISFETDVTRVLREAFISQANVPIVPREQAHMVLIGKVVDVRTEALTFDLDQRRVHGHDVTYSTTKSRRLKVEMDARLIDRVSGATVWHEPSMSDEARFEVSVDPLTTNHNRREALRRIADRLAKRLYLKTMERF